MSHIYIYIYIYLYVFEVGESGIHGWSVIWIYMDLDHCLNGTATVARFWIINCRTDFQILHTFNENLNYFGAIVSVMFRKCAFYKLRRRGWRKSRSDWGKGAGVDWEGLLDSRFLSCWKFSRTNSIPKNHPVQTQMPRRTSPICSPKHLHETMCLKLHHARGINMCLFGNWRGAMVFLFHVSWNCNLYILFI